MTISPKGSLARSEVAEPSPGRHNLLIEVAAASVNRADDRLAVPVPRQVTDELLPAMTQGKLRPPIDRTYPPQRAAEAQAQAHMAANQHRGKLVRTIA